MRPPLVTRAALAALLLFLPAPLLAQPFTPPAQVGSVTIVWQWVDNTGHFLGDGFLLERGPSVTTSALVEVEYGVTDRFAASVGVPYVFARYTGDLPPLSQLPRDSCRCWNSSFQDFSFGARYRFGDQFLALTPQIKYGAPTHAYPYEGEAVVGSNLRQLLLGLHGGARLTSVLPRAAVQVGYSYSIVEQPLDDVSMNRSNGYFDLGYPLTRQIFVRGGATWQYTHGGLTAGGPTTIPFPGELNTPERYAQRDRVLSTKYWHVSGGMAYSFGTVDVFGSIEKYVWGRDTHNGIAYSLGASWYFDLSRKAP